MSPEKIKATVYDNMACWSALAEEVKCVFKRIGVEHCLALDPNGVWKPALDVIGSHEFYNNFRYRVMPDYNILFKIGDESYELHTALRTMTGECVVLLEGSYINIACVPAYASFMGYVWSDDFISWTLERRRRDSYRYEWPKVKWKKELVE